MSLRKLWLVSRTTYLLNVRSPMFLVMTLLLPVIMVVAGLIPVLLGQRRPNGVMGAVDLSGRLALPSTATQGSTLVLNPYESPAAAQAAMQNGEIVSFVVLPEDYLESGRLTYYGASAAGEGQRQALSAALRRALAPDAPDWLHDRLNGNVDWHYADLDTGRTLDQGLEVYIWSLAPVALALIFILLLTTTLNSVGPAIVREKEERAMEIVLTSLRTTELIGGKLLGITFLTLTQLLVWLAGAAVAIAILWSGEGRSGIPSLPWPVFGWGLLLGAPGFMFYSALAAGVGIMAGNREQARQTAGLLSFLAIAPLFAMSGALGNPDGPTTVALSLLPPFAPTLLLFRMLVTTVPAWQLVSGVVLLWLGVLLALWVTVRLFRASALLYGQSLRPGQVWRALVDRSPVGERS